MTPQDAENWAKIIERYGLAIIMCIILGGALFMTIRWLLYKIDNKVDNILKKCSDIIDDSSVCSTCSKNLDEIRKDITTMKQSLMIHTQQNKSLKEKIQDLIGVLINSLDRLSNDVRILIKEMLKGGNINNDSKRKR